MHLIIRDGATVLADPGPRLQKFLSPASTSELDVPSAVLPAVLHFWDCKTTQLRWKLHYMCNPRLVVSTTFLGRSVHVNEWHASSYSKSRSRSRRVLCSHLGTSSE